eukprot:TRINITY_DN14106_c0_g1_i1.p1 TRINITY_DN14106_c0_g1~~TRINITY_DN14106_c0_g1_i1.p1  ORF type:complete len:570 (+),score=219.25 TRINITY_DN14106_c0_g1_i1:96-1712(+)
MAAKALREAVLSELQSADGRSLPKKKLLKSLKAAVAEAAGDDGGKEERKEALDSAIAKLVKAGKVTEAGDDVTLGGADAPSPRKRGRTSAAAETPSPKRARGAEQAAEPKAEPGQHEIFIRFLPYWTTEDNLWELFAEAGEIVGKPTLLRDAGGKCKGAGWVSFATEKAMWEAISWSGYAYGGRHLEVTKAKKYSHGHTPTVQQYGTHTPALLAEVLRRVVGSDRDGVYVDGTFGRGGHTRQMLAQLSPQGRMHAFDLDMEAVEVARKLEKEDSRFTIHHCPFGSMVKALGGTKVSGVLLDLGISSPQFDDANRGFRPEEDGPLDLRFDLTSGQTAREFLSTAPREEIIRVLREYGDGTDPIVARRVADAVCVLRSTTGIPERTRAFAAVCERVKGREYQLMHPAKLIFQAIRIHLNDEFGELRRGLEGSLELLKEGGRIGIISWKHSECAIIMDFVRRYEFAQETFPLLQWYREQDGARTLPKSFGVTMEDPSKPSDKELKENSRSRSALLHILTKGKGVRVVDLEDAAYPLLDWSK